MSGQAQLLRPQSLAATVGPSSEDNPFGLASQQDRIRDVFGLPAGVPLPRVTLHSLGKYHAYLSAHLSFPFRAICRESRRPMTLLVRYISVVKMLALAGPIARGIICRVKGVAETTDLPLMEIGVREDDPNAQTVDDFAHWFFNYL